MEHNIDLAYAKETKNTVVYSTTKAGAVITQVYINKSAFEGEAPLVITINVKG